MATFLSDTFTGVAGTNLDARTGEVGATWTKHALSGSGVARLSDVNRVRAAVTGVAGTSFYYYGSGSPLTAEVSIAAAFYFASLAGTRAGITGRVDAVALTHYTLDYLVTSEVWRLRKMVEGAATTLGEYADKPGAGVTRQVILQLANAKKSVFIDGVERISSADNSIAATGKVGVVFQDAVTNTTGIHIDSMSATDYIAPSSGSQLPLSRRNRIVNP